jgi:hypothetical protein
LFDIVSYTAKHNVRKSQHPDLAVIRSKSGEILLFTARIALLHIATINFYRRATPDPFLLALAGNIGTALRATASSSSLA